MCVNVVVSIMSIRACGLYSALHPDFISVYSILGPERLDGFVLGFRTSGDITSKKFGWGCLSCTSGLSRFRRDCGGHMSHGWPYACALCLYLSSGWRTSSYSLWSRSVWVFRYVGKIKHISKSMFSIMGASDWAQNVPIVNCHISIIVISTMFRQGLIPRSTDIRYIWPFYGILHVSAIWHYNNDDNSFFNTTI